MLRFRINADALGQIAEGLRGRAKATALRAVAAEHERLIVSAFDQGGVDPVTGSPGAWPQKAIPEGRRSGSRKRHSDPTPRLTDTGALKGSIAARVDDNGYEIGPAPLPYAAIHQFGGEITITPRMRAVLRGLGFRPRRSTETVRIPARPYIVLPEPWLEILQETFTDTVLAVGGE